MFIDDILHCSACMNRRDGKPCEYPQSHQGQRTDLYATAHHPNYLFQKSKNSKRRNTRSDMRESFNALNRGTGGSCDQDTESQEALNESGRIRGKKLFFCD